MLKAWARVAKQLCIGNFCPGHGTCPHMLVMVAALAVVWRRQHHYVSPVLDNSDFLHLRFQVYVGAAIDSCNTFPMRNCLTKLGHPCNEAATVTTFTDEMATDGKHQRCR